MRKFWLHHHFIVQISWIWFTDFGALARRRCYFRSLSQSVSAKMSINGCVWKKIISQKLRLFCRQRLRTEAWRNSCVSLYMALSLAVSLSQFHDLMPLPLWYLNAESRRHKRQWEQRLRYFRFSRCSAVLTSVFSSMRIPGFIVSLEN